jgi:hypothetical protein
MGWTLRSSLLLAVLLIGCNRPGPSPSPPPKVQVGGVDTPITAERLNGSRLILVAGDPGVEWVFHDSTFFVDSGKAPLPKDIAEALLGSGKTSTRVEGKWRLDEAKSELVLTELRAGDQPGRETCVLPIRPAGAVRANLGERQYNVFPASKRP